MLLVLCLPTSTVLGQNYLSIRQTQINQTQINQTQNNQINNIQVGPSSYSVMYAVNAFVNVYNDSKKEQRAKDEAQSKLMLMKQTYNSYETFPDSIVTGWHNVIVTDNLKFCRDAKVFVRNNRIEEFVIENCYSLNFTAAGKIKNARNVLTLNKFNGDQLEIVDVYFLYDLDEPRLVTPPLVPGYVTFWTKKKGYINHKIIIEGTTYDGVTQVFKVAPRCDEFGTLTLVLKPGTYSFRAMKSGNDLDGVVNVKSDQCLLQLLN
jgi:hypothetical protein